ncbi:MAG: hypothetical protein IKT89_05720 [Clostridia bacterium]|nr:hypothetical protein [Clostridia bacterium]
MSLLNDFVYEDGLYWVVLDKNGYIVAKNNGVCGDVIGYAGTFEQAKEIIELNKRSGK